MGHRSDANSFLTICIFAWIVISHCMLDFLCQMSLKLLEVLNDFFLSLMSIGFCLLEAASMWAVHLMAIGICSFEGGSQVL